MTGKRLITGMLAVLVIAAVMAPSLMAQSLVTGDITGTVTDPSGAVVSGATVMLKSNGERLDAYRDNRFQRNLPILFAESGQLHRECQRFGFQQG